MIAVFVVSGLVLDHLERISDSAHSAQLGPKYCLNACVSINGDEDKHLFFFIIIPIRVGSSRGTLERLLNSVFHPFV